MKHLLIGLSLITNFIFSTGNSNLFLVSNGNTEHIEIVKKALDNQSIPYTQINTIAEKESQSLYIIFDLFKSAIEELPQYYITYQSLDLTKNPLNADYSKKLSKSIAVWDYSFANINRYSSSISQYYYFPKDYEFADTVILPCQLPLATLEEYKKVLVYSNNINGDISSHLPAIFCYTVIQQPKFIVEAGVRGGESTSAFLKALKFCDTAHLIGLDIEPSTASSYPISNNTSFVCMNDLDFLNYYNNSFMQNSKIDVIFIDTSHLYEHTLQELGIFEPLLSENGIMMFHDSNVTPLNNNTGYVRINGTYGSAAGNTRGVTQALKEYFAVSFDESKYCNFILEKNGIFWQLIHYPYCNGLTILKKLIKRKSYSEKNILVFGGKTGWIGLKIVKILNDLGYNAVGAQSRLENRESIIDEISKIQPIAIINAAGITGKPNVDWCEDHRQETLRTNVIGTLNLADIAYCHGIHLTNISTGCIYEYDEKHPMGSGIGFTEEEEPNFDGSFYSKTKIVLEKLLLEYPNVLNLRIKMPVSKELDKGFIGKISKYKKLINIPNSLCVLEDLLPIAIDMTLKNIKGNFNFVNPGTISHNEIMDLYKYFVDPNHTYENFTVEEQAKILKSRRANAELSPAKLVKLYPDILHIKESIIKIFDQQ